MRNNFKQFLSLLIQSKDNSRIHKIGRFYIIKRYWTFSLGTVYILFNISYETELYLTMTIPSTTDQDFCLKIRSQFSRIVICKFSTLHKLWTNPFSPPTLRVLKQTIIQIRRGTLCVVPWMTVTFLTKVLMEITYLRLRYPTTPLPSESLLTYHYTTHPLIVGQTSKSTPYTEGNYFISLTRILSPTKSTVNNTIDMSLRKWERLKLKRERIV